MFWYPNSIVFRFYLLSAATFLCFSCESEQVSLQHGAQQYYPLHAFFRAEVDSLQQASSPVQKTVWKDGDSESKVLSISDWSQELGAFLSIDLTKSIYLDAFEIKSEGNTTTYIARDSSVDIRSINLEKDTLGQLEKVTIEKKVNNLLYSNCEKLEYARDHHYALEKYQQIFLLGKSTYRIEGRFN